MKLSRPYDQKPLIDNQHIGNVEMECMISVSNGALRKVRARRVFAERLAAGAGGNRAARLVSHVLLARALAAHEDQNRHRKMRLLRDLRDLADLAQLPLETASLPDLAEACGASSGGDTLLASTAS